MAHPIFLKIVMQIVIILNFCYFIGPAFWGLINPEWSLCNKGRRQSPINLEPQRLLFDPSLRPLHVDKHRVSRSHICCNIKQFFNFR